MKKSELKALIKETIEGIQAEAAKVAPSGTTYTFSQLNKLLRANKIVVFFKNDYDGAFVEIDGEQGFYMQKNNDGEKTVHASDGTYEYEYGIEFDEVYVAQRVNIK